MRQKKYPRKIFENIYYASLEMSMEISKKRDIKIKRYNELRFHKTEEERKEFELLTEELKLIPEELNETNI